MQPTTLPHPATYAPSSSSQAQGERFTRVENRNRQETVKDDSWIEVSSQPSDDAYSTSSSEIILEGLNVQSTTGAQQRIRKKKKGSSSKATGIARDNKVYDTYADDLSDTESISPGLGSGGSSGPASSIEQLPKQEDFDSSSSAAGEESDSSSDEAREESNGDAGTLLGVDCGTGTRPSSYSSQVSQKQQQATASRPPINANYYPHPRTPAVGSSTGERYSQYSHYSRQLPTKKSHDEALMSSLSTLLSCAAAARALPKAVAGQQGVGGSSGGQNRAGTLGSGRVQLETLQLVPDRLLGETGGPTTGTFVIPPGAREQSEPEISRRDSLTRVGAIPSPFAITQQSSIVQPTISRRKPTSLSPTMSDNETTRKRRSSPGVKSSSSRRSQSPRPTRKSSSLFPLPLEESLNVSFLTLAVSAGAVVVLSAVAFSAGYALGKEVGKNEAEVVGGMLGNATKEVIREGARGSGRGLVGGMGSRVVSVSA